MDGNKSVLDSSLPFARHTERAVPDMQIRTTTTITKSDWNGFSNEDTKKLFLWALS